MIKLRRKKEGFLKCLKKLFVYFYRLGYEQCKKDIMEMMEEANNGH